jgi:hypothetical protein
MNGDLLFTGPASVWGLFLCVPLGSQIKHEHSGSSRGQAHQRIPFHSSGATPRAMISIHVSRVGSHERGSIYDLAFFSHQPSRPRSSHRRRGKLVKAIFKLSAVRLPGPVRPRRTARRHRDELSGQAHSSFVEARAPPRDRALHWRCESANDGWRRVRHAHGCDKPH